LIPQGAGDSAAEAAAADAAAAQGGLLGRRVLVQGLEGKKELNGCKGVAVQYDEEKG